MLKSAKNVLSEGRVSEVVDFAIETHREITSSTVELEAVKPFLREEGLRRQADTNSKSSEKKGPLCSATIVRVRDEPRVRKGVRVED